MDNRRIEVKSVSEEDFKFAMILAFSKYDRAKQNVKWFKTDLGKLLLYDYQHDGAKDLPYPMGIYEATAFAWGWIKANSPVDKQPDHDGDNSKGFHLIADSWLDNHLVSVESIWAMYGK